MRCGQFRVDGHGQTQLLPHCKEPVSYTHLDVYKRQAEGDEQFEIDDNRSLDKMYHDIAEEGLQPVLNDYVYV